MLNATNLRAANDSHGATTTRSEQQATRGGLKRYNLVLPSHLFEEVEQVAAEQQTSVVEVLRRFIKLGLIAVQVEKSPGSALIIREGDTEREIILL